ncbi:MAG: hypothetical protein M3144_10710 [Actinomycetota bacterium]|nr:hypothetical protein [Actinomycetota bacterium]
MTLVLVLLVPVVAAAGGFLGDLLELAGLLVVLLVIAGAIRCRALVGDQEFAGPVNSLASIEARGYAIDNMEAHTT